MTVESWPPENSRAAKMTSALRESMEQDTIRESRLGHEVAKHAKRCMERPEYQAFTTKDSGERTEFSTGMVRDTTTGKPRFDLIDPADLPYNQTMTYRHAMLMQRGAEKYGARNWEKASTPEELERFRESAYRHFMQWYHGETDEDHASAVLFNIRGVTLVEWRMEQEVLNDETF